MKDENIDMIGDQGERKSKYDPDLARRLNREADEEERNERMKRRINGENKEGVKDELEGMFDTGSKDEPLVEKSEDYWTIPGVKYRGKVESWDLSNTLLKGTQHHLTLISNISRRAHGFGIPQLSTA